MMVNPVIRRELIERLRGLRAFLAITVFVGVLTLTTFLVFEAQAASARFDLSTRTGTGRLVFETVILVMAILVMFFVPSLTAGAIAGERERQTLATLQVTMLRTRSILFGKIAAALMFLLLMFVAALPVLSVAYILGGVRLVDIGRGVLAVAVIGVLMATMVVAVSSFARRTQTATMMAYGFTLFVCLMGPLVYLIGFLLDARTPDDRTIAPAWLLTVNPFVLLADLGSGNQSSINAPLSLIREGLGNAKTENDGRWFAWFPDPRPDNGAFAVANPGHPVGGVPAWLIGLVVLGLIAVGFQLLAVRRLRTPAEVER
ncbi:hypothetical protein BH24ACT5_BH24ACT5_03120 [soil metagenome]